MDSGSLVASAGFADVHKGRMAGSGQQVAVKKLRHYGDRNTRMHVAVVSLLSYHLRHS